MRLWYLSRRRPAKAQASLRMRAVTQEPSLFAHMKYGSGQMVRPKSRHLAPENNNGNLSFLRERCSLKCKIFFHYRVIINRIFSMPQCHKRIYSCSLMRVPLFVT